VWTTYGWAFKCGSVLLALSIAFLGLTLGVLLDLIPA